MPSVKKWLREVAAMLETEAPGSSVEVGRAGHLRITLPGAGFLSASGTPGDGHALTQIKQDVRRRLRSTT